MGMWSRMTFLQTIEHTRRLCKAYYWYASRMHWRTKLWIVNQKGDFLICLISQRNYHQLFTQHAEYFLWRCLVKQKCTWWTVPEIYMKHDVNSYSQHWCKCGTRHSCKIYMYLLALFLCHLLAIMLSNTEWISTSIIITHKTVCEYIGLVIAKNGCYFVAR